MSHHIGNTSKENHIYCFEIKLTNNESLFLTSASYDIIIDNKIFVPNSGLSFQEALFNDSAQNHIILTGIFETNGIDRHLSILDAEVKILIYSNNQLVPFVTYYCSHFTAYDLHFTIQLAAETNKYGQSVLNSFSKLCRANFGDTKCKIDKNLYMSEYGLLEIAGKILKVLDIKHENGYFNGGEIKFDGNYFSARIQRHLISEDPLVSNIMIDRLIPANTIAEALNSKKIYLIAGCDKKLITCCNKFNNTVNFRGEPFIPEKNFLRINQ